MRTRLIHLKQEIGDSDFQSLKELIPAEVLAFNYSIGRTRRDVSIDTIKKIDYSLIILKPYLEEYMRKKEDLLGKKMCFFSEKEKLETLEEMESLYHVLKKEKLVY